MRKISSKDYLNCIITRLVFEFKFTSIYYYLCSRQSKDFKKEIQILQGAKLFKKQNSKFKHRNRE